MSSIEALLYDWELLSLLSGRDLSLIFSQKPEIRRVLLDAWFDGAREENAGRNLFIARILTKVRSFEEDLACALQPRLG